MTTTMWLFTCLAGISSQKWGGLLNFFFISAKMGIIIIFFVEEQVF